MFEEQYANYPAPTVETHPQRGHDGRAQGRGDQAGRPARGAQVDHLRQRRVHRALLPPQLHDPIASMPGLGNPYRGDAGAPQATDDRSNCFAEADMISATCSRCSTTLNRQNTSIYAVDPRGLAAFEYDINEGVGLSRTPTGCAPALDTLHVLADNTDGRAIVNRNDLAAG